ncbi:MAG: hypothetical protein SV760_01280 [Halobacteria archaeon]|nr:hypothetical protein [Halobacteria archaeon]
MAENQQGINTSRLARLYTLIGLVTAVFLFTSANVIKSDVLFSVAVFAIGSVALVTAIIGFLIAAASSFDTEESE